jgi:hypothetical protein
MYWMTQAQLSMPGEKLRLTTPLEKSNFGEREEKT